MVKKNNFVTFQFLILFILNIVFVISIKKIYYPGDKDRELDGKQSEYIQIIFRSQIKQKFLKMFVITTGNNINQEIIMSKTINEPNRATADLFAEEPYGNVTMYVPKELIEDSFYINCSCYSQKCPFIIELSETDDLSLSRDGQHSFLSNPSSVEYKYYVHRSDYRNNSYFDQKAIMTLFVIGPPETTEVHINYLYPNNDETENITIPIPCIRMDNGYITSFNEEEFEYNVNGFYEIEVKSKDINYITVGSRSTVEGFYEKANHIFPNKRGIFGYFNNSMLSGECFAINLPYLNNIDPENLDYNLYANYLVFSELAEVYFLNKKTGEEIDNKTKAIEGELGVIVTMDDVKNNVICIRPTKGKQSVLYYLELSDYNQGRGKTIYSPQISGHIYTRYLPINSHLFFTHKELSIHGDEIIYNVKTLQGITRSYYVYCESYPSCSFNNYTELDNEIKKGNENIALLKGTHNMVTYSSYYEEEESIISSKQHLLLVFCLNSTICKFETSFFNKQIYINLKPDDLYFQHLSISDSNLFRLHFYKKFPTIEKIIFSLTTFNGNLNIELLKGHENYEKQYYYAGNKQIIIFTPINEKSDDIELKIICNYNSFYSIEYSMLSTEFEETKFIDEGASIIQTINGHIGEKKIFTMKNNRKEEKANYLVNFYSLNCKVKVNRGKTQIQSENNFSQDLISPSMNYYSKELYEYKLEVIEMDNTIQESPLCFVQISNFEMNSNNLKGDYEERSITIPAEYDYQINLEKTLPEIKLLYPHSSPNENIYFDFILEQELEIKINFSIESYILGEYIISRRQLIPITSMQINNAHLCKNSSLCCIIISISANIPENVEYINIRVNTKTKNNDPTFIKRGELKKDTLIEDHISYYYTEINKDEVGYITVNFNRASGEVFAKILNIEETEEKIKNEDPIFWLGKYNLPTKKSQTDLSYNPFTKNIVYYTEDTKHCFKACFALLAIKSTIKNENNLTPKSYDISIAVHEDEEYTLIERSIDIPVNEFIIGSISSQDQLINYFQYYTFDVLTDSEIIYIDINSDSCNLYVKLGEDKPTMKTADFTFMSKGEESVYEISINDQIFKEQGLTSLKGLRFTFAIGTTYANTLYTTLYAFRLRTPKKDKNDFINMNTDQVGLCSIKKDSYCYFLINLKKEEKNVNEILMHAFSTDKTTLKLFANILSNDIINSGDNELIRQNLPNEEKADFKSTDNYITDYLRFNVDKINNKNNSQSFILVGVLANNNTVVNFISTFYKYSVNFKANSFTKQIFLLLKGQEVILEFPEDLNLIVKIISIYGEGRLLYENEDDLNDKHLLHGSYDEISFINRNKNIIVKSNNDQEFGFYLMYNMRPAENYDVILYGSSTLFNLEKDYDEKIDFPLIYYCKINSNEPVDFNIKIIDLEYGENSPKSDSFNKDTNDFQILGVITKESIILGKKMNQYVNPDMSDAKYGIYDQALNIGKVYFSSEDIEKFSKKQDKESENEDKYLYITITKAPSNNNIYKKIASDISILPSNNIKYKAHIRQYNFANIINENSVNKYNLISDNQNAKIMRIEIAKNNKNIDFSITSPESENYKQNMTFIKSENKFGRTVILLDIPENYYNVYLYIFLNDKTKIDNEKLNIVFKYEVFETKEESEAGINTLKSEQIENSFDNNILNLKIKPMQKKDKNIDAVYSIRIIPQDNAHEEDILDSISLYSFENEYIYSKKFYANEDDIEIKINDFPSKEALYYITVFATSLDTGEFLAYKLIEIGNRNITIIENENNTKYKVMMYILIGAIGILVLVLIIVIIRMKRQNAKLEDEVEVLKFNFDDESEKNKNRKISLIGQDESK